MKAEIFRLRPISYGVTHAKQYFGNAFGIVIEWKKRKDKPEIERKFISCRKIIMEWLQSKNLMKLLEKGIK